MPINNITQTISELPAAGRRGVDVQTQFVVKQEDFQDHLQGTTVTELNTLKDQLNSRIGEINSTATTMNGYASTASAGASTATTKAGEASASASEALTSRNQAETFKNNASASATKASQWADNNYNVEVETGRYSAKHWSVVAENTVEGTVKLTGNQTVDGTKTFSSNIVGDVTGNACTATKLATARTINGVSFDGSTNITVSDSTAVKLTGNQTVDGTKTFTSSPISTSTQSTAIDALTRKDYVDTKVEKVTSTDNAIVRFDGTTGKVQNSGVVIDDNNNVGIGVTPSAWGSAWKSLDLLSSSITSYTTLTDPYTSISNNAYISGSSSTTSSVYKNNGSANSYSQGGGAHVWRIAPLGTAGNTITWTNAMILDSNGVLTLNSPTGVLGYGTGSGGTVTQLTSKSTAVTLNKPTGRITMHNAELAGNASVGFTLNNSLIDVPNVVICSCSNGNYRVYSHALVSGLALIEITNRTGALLSESFVINFTVIKGATS